MKEQIEFDIDTLNTEFTKMSGIWEYNDGDPYACTDLSIKELTLVKNIAKRYPDFKYIYEPEEFCKYDEWYDDQIFTLEDFENDNIHNENYGKVDAVAFDMKEELVNFLEKL